MEEYVCPILAPMREYAKNNPNVIAIRFLDDKTWSFISYEELLAKVDAVAKRFKSYGLKPGSRVILLEETHPNWLITLFAIFACQATAVNLDPRLPSSDLEDLIEKADAQILLTSESFLVEDRLPLPSQMIILDIHRDYAAIQSNIDNGNGAIKIPEAVDPDPSAAFLLFTSGTTGALKGVILTREAICFTLERARKFTLVGPDDEILLLLPLHHIYGVMMSAIINFWFGSTVTILSDIREQVMTALKETQTTALMIVPKFLELFYERIESKVRDKGLFYYFLFKGLLSVSCFAKKYLSLNLGKIFFKQVHQSFGGKFRFFVSGGAPLAPIVYQKWEAMGFTVLEGYGLTETGGLVCCNPCTTEEKSGVGELMDDIEVIIDNKNEEGIGEICVKGSNLMKGYFRDEKTTEEVMRDGWFHTGDLGKFDKNNHLIITGRIKELIVLPNGKKAIPHEVENHYQNISGVSELAVIGIYSDEINGEEVHGVVTMSDRYKVKFSVEERKKRVEKLVYNRSKKIPKEYQIRHLHFMKEIPKTATLKVKRGILKDEIIKKIKSE